MSVSAAVGEALHRTFLHNWYQLPGWLALAVALIAALRWGGWAERWIGLWLLADYVVHALVRQGLRAAQGGEPAPAWSALVVDLMFAPAYLWPVARSIKAWPLFFAAFYLLMTMTHLVRVVMPEVGEWAGATGVVVWTALAQLAFTVGVAGCALERRRRA